LSVKGRPASLQLVRLNLQQSPPPLPDFLERTGDEPPQGRVSRLPTRGDVDPRIADLREQLILEFCSR
jgi:small subunit ribosomal protein S4